MIKRLCKCGLKDLHSLRLAMEITQREMASILGVTDRQVRYVESNNDDHVCMSPRTLTNLRLALQEAHYCITLKKNNFPHPFPMDHNSPYFWESAIGPRCHLDGIPLRKHSRCVSCTRLSGPLHEVLVIDNNGLCLTCREAIKKGERMLVR